MPRPAAVHSRSSPVTTAIDTPVTDRLRLTEIFHSLQGEAASVGWPTVFVRLTGCPLRCGYCDTAYAFHGGQWWEIDSILTEVARHAWIDRGDVDCAGSFQRHVITGIA